MQPVLSDDQAHYIQGLVRMHIRKIRKTIARFAPKDGQPEEEAAAVLDGFRARLGFAEDTYRALGGDPGQMAPKGGRP